MQHRTLQRFAHVVHVHREEDEIGLGGMFLVSVVTYLQLGWHVLLQAAEDQLAMYKYCSWDCRHQLFMTFQKNF